MLERNRDYVLLYLRLHPCVDCEESDPVVLEFDHVSGTKLGHVTKLMYQKKKLEVLAAEIAKCQVRCANCHRRKTAFQFGSYRLSRRSNQSLESSLKTVSS
jgi:hypothetical protein